MINHSRPAIAIFLFFTLTASVSFSQDSGYKKEVKVSADTRLDWVFALSNQSRIDPPAEWLAGYDSKEQRYELFVPPGPPKAAAKGAKKKPMGRQAEEQGLPVILFISPGDEPSGWAQLQTVCQQRKMIFASPYNAGNNISMPKRVRIVLDVLDDLRRNHDIDPERTYLGGFSGGGRTACGIIFALPELFGGVMPVCAGGELREESWLKHRAIDRLSVAMITGTEDFNRGEVERFRGPMLTDIGIRTKVTVVPKLGHGIPDAKTFSDVITWLDAGAAERRKLAQKYPASRIGREQTPGRDQWAKSLLAEGSLRLKDPKTLYAGLMQLQGVTQRWPDLKEADEAKQILVEYDARPDHPWEADDIAEQRKFLVARARALSSYGMGDLPDQYAKQRKEMLHAAINLWELVVQDGKDEKAVAEAARRLPALKKRLEMEQ